MRADASDVWLTIVGIGEDGFDGLGIAARVALAQAEVLVGSARQLALVPEVAGVRLPWPTPLLPFVDQVLTDHRGRRVVMLASGDPMLHGIGAIVAARLPAHELRVVPQPSAFALACARLGWPEAEVVLVSVVAKPLARVRRELTPGRRVVVYSENGETPRVLAATLTEAGFGTSVMHVFERLGGPHERRVDGTAEAWQAAACNDLNVVAFTAIASPGTRTYTTLAGLPDDAFANDGALTKREVRAATLARLAPLPGELLWDVGAGSGSIGIEWSRAHPSCRTIAFERNAERAIRIARNAEVLGVPELRVVTGSVPDAFDAYEVGPRAPDAIFLGGGLNADANLLDVCWGMLRPGGRIMINVVTVAGESVLAHAQSQYGGELSRIAVARAEAVGGVLGWRPAMPVTQWHAVKP